MSRTRILVIAILAASFLVYVPTASAAPGDPLSGFTSAQCANDAPPSTSKACPGGWISSILQSSNSHYREDEVVPQRLLMTIPSGGDTHTVTISYAARKGSAAAHGFDHLATWDHTQDQAQPCQGLAASLCSGTPSTFQMASDTTAVQPVGAGISANTNMHELPAGAREWTMYGAASITGTSAVTHSEPTNTSKDDEASVTLTITGSSAGGQALLLFGGHLAVSGGSSVPRAWGAGLGASFVNGGPYHIGLSAVDGKKVTAQNNIQAGAVQSLAPANFTVEKSVDDATATPGQEVEYTVSVTNTGEESGSTSFVDDYDDGIDPGEVTSDPAGGSCVEADGTLTCQTSSIAAGGTQTFTYTATMPGTFEGESGTGGCAAGSFPITNTVSLDGDAGNDSATVCVEAAAAFTIEKTVDDDTATPGQEVAYTVTVTNNGSTAGSTSFVDDFSDRLDPSDATSDPAGGTCVETTTGNELLTCQTSSIAAGGTQTFTYTATMPETFEGESGTGGCETGSFPITNTATLDGDAGTDGATVCVEAAAAFTIEKTVDDDTATPGQEVAYTVTVTNNGSTAGSTSFVDDFSDRLDPSDATSDPAGGTCVETTTGNELLTCQTSSIAAGGTQTFTYTATMPETFEGESGTGGCETGSFPITNTATLDGDAGTDGATVCVEAAAAFTIEKTVDDDTASPGQEVEYTVTVTNSGSTSGSTSFVDDFSDRLDPSDVTSDPAGGTCVETTTGNELLTCQTSSIASGGTQTFTYTATMPDTFEGESGTGGCETGSFPIDNTATLDGGAGADGATVCVEAAPEFTIEKTVDDDTATPGQVVAYTITVTNTGSTPGSTSFVDDFDDSVDPSDVTSDPAGGTCVEAEGTLTCDTGSIAPDAAQTFTYTATMPETFEGESGTGGCEAGSFPITNTATLDGEAGDNGATVCVEAAAAFTIEKTVDDETATPGQEVEYTITVTNNGSTSGATSFVDDFADRLDPSDVTSDPEGGSCVETTTGNELLTCDTSAIAPGDTQTFSYTATMPETFDGDSGTGGCETGSFPIDNTATLDGEASADSVTVCVEAAPEFTIEKTVDDETATPGQEVAYTITVTNNGSTAGATTFVDDFDDGLDPSDVTSDPAGATCVEAEGTLTCDTGSIGPDETQTFTYTATVPETFDGEPGTGGCDPGSFPVTNTATLDGETADEGATVCVAAAPDFAIEKTVDDETATPGQEVEYTITVTNGGTAAGATSFVDDFADSLDPSLPVSDPAGGTCTAAESGNETFTCETGTIAAGDDQQFTYTAVLPLTFDGEGGGDCAPGSFPVVNTVTIDGGADDGATVCVEASPDLTVTKSADDETPSPGDVVTYTIMVSNTGSAPGSTIFVDDFDDRLDPSTPEAESEGGSCTEITTGNLRFECETGTIAAGGVQTFIYTATMPETISGDAGDCDPGGFPVANTVTPDQGEPVTVTVCVQASPELSLVKSVETDHDSSGNEFLTYTLEYTNNGSSDAPTALINDEIPDGTVFESCTDECDTTGSPASSATWAVGPIAAQGGTGSVTLTVRVDTNEACEVTNVATIQFGLSPAVSSNTVVTSITPKANPAGAHANGSAKGAQVETSGLLSLPARLEQPISTAATSQTGLGGPKLDSQSVLAAKIPGGGSLLRVDALRTTSASVVTPSPMEARQTSTAEVAKVCVVPIGGLCTVEAGTVRAVSSTIANGGTASTSSAGSTIQNLKILGVATPVDLNQTTKIPLSRAIFGAGSYVAINERSGPGGQPQAGLNGGSYTADQTVTMIHVKITGVLGLQAAEVVVSQATAHSDFPRLAGCPAAAERSVSGHAFVAGLFTGPLVADLLQGYTQISPLGGFETQQVAAVRLPQSGSVLAAQAADSRSQGTVDALKATSFSLAEIAGNGAGPACVLRLGPTCAITATAVRSASQSTANAGGASSSASGTMLTNLRVLGLPISGTPDPNRTITLPGVGFVVFNEQFCDDGTTTSHSCSGATHSGLTVRAVRVVVTVANNLLGLTPGVELIVAEAHSDATYN